MLFMTNVCRELSCVNSANPSSVTSLQDHTDACILALSMQLKCLQWAKQAGLGPPDLGQTDLAPKLTCVVPQVADGFQQHFHCLNDVQ